MADWEIVFEDHKPSGRTIAVNKARGGHGVFC
jgi:hypothetical protein